MIKFKTILIDPPWSYNNKSNRAAPDCSTHWDYPTMHINQIKSLPIKAIIDNQAHLYLWCTDSFKEAAYMVTRYWDFTPKMELVWVKTDKSGQKLVFGMGNYFRHSCEYVLFGVKGNLKTLTHNTPNVFFAARETHSKKPDVIYDIIEKNSPEPRIELFARNIREGWYSWGNELTEKSLIEFVSEIIRG